MLINNGITYFYKNEDIGIFYVVSKEKNVWELVVYKLGLIIFQSKFKNKKDCQKKMVEIDKKMCRKEELK